MDTMYVPGFHNMLSMYQSTISTHYLESDAMAAKYLTDSQLAAIAAMSPAMKKRNEGEGTRKINDSTGPVEVIGSQERMQSQLYKFTVNNNFSLATKKFLERYGLHDD
ncbi:uncharacterized protein LOC121855411 [Homarus americanus]|nr:uncharacterized protein LOC121855411 [Homarus americanus]